MHQSLNMKVCYTLICFIFLTLQDGNTGLVNGRIHTGKEGGNITVGCSFTFSGSRRLFCRNKCEEGNILIDTTEDKAQRDRYSIEYINTGVLSNTLYVSITQLKKSDSGWYRCSLRERTWFKDSSEDFEITVTEASTTSQPTLTPGTVSTSAFLSSASTSPTSTSTSTSISSSTLSSSSGSSTSSSFSSSGATGQHEASPTGSDLILYVALTLVFMIIILSVALMIFCKWRRTTKPKGSPIESVYTDVTRTDRLYEEIREDKRSSSPPEGISTVYTCAKYVKPNGAESSDDYSLNQSPQERDEDDSSKLNYSEVDFSNVAVKSHNSALVDNVIYSAPQTETNSTNHAMGASPPLYSTLQ
ncbi:uncharacterized serine-rich protein C215.13-like isoform X2 [Mugil cephalus]|uniref:uncharacterized serine-rich protein C215.13-like isoform X2 n=1 Tax=Mugil cephalus TaxID=48193 RepID=UPI001FB74488|nr:uncharacterized serine-rich protein C215.13-like isoform X2 [Mugil cephalus]